MKWCIIVDLMLIGHFKEDFIYLFLEREEGRDKEREQNINVRNINQLPLLCAPAWD